MRNKNVVDKVQDALGKDAALSNCIDNISIMEYDGMVIIAGSLPQARLRIRAKELASVVEGVNFVVEDIKVEPTLQRRVDVHIDWAMGKIGVVC